MVKQGNRARRRRRPRYWRLNRGHHGRSDDQPRYRICHKPRCRCQTRAHRQRHGNHWRPTPRARMSCCHSRLLPCHVQSSYRCQTFTFSQASGDGASRDGATWARRRTVCRPSHRVSRPSVDHGPGESSAWVRSLSKNLWIFPDRVDGRTSTTIDGAGVLQEDHTFTGREFRRQTTRCSQHHRECLMAPLCIGSW